MKKLLAIGLVVLMFSGCATILKGDSAKVTFTSTPTQAQVLIDGSPIGVTTIEAVLKVNRSYNITFRKAGFADQTYVLTNRVGALWIVLDVLSGLVPLVIDAATGAWYEFDTTNVNVTLTPQALTEKPLPDWAKLALKRAYLQIGR